MRNEEEAQNIESAGSEAERTSYILMAVNFLLAASLNFIWSMLNGLQLATHMPLTRVKTPANADYVLDYLIEVATFDPLPVEAIWAILAFPERDPYNEAFDSAGYNYIYSVENLGTAFIMIHIYVFITIFSSLAYYFGCTRVTGSKIFRKVVDQLFFGPMLRFVFEGYLEISISICISLLYLNWSSEEGIAVLYCNIFTTILAAVLVGLPIYICFYYSINM